MASYYTTIPDPDRKLVCPYDKAHYIRVKRMPYHLMACRKNHPTKNFKVCHFNARHEVPEEEFRLHLTICPDKDSGERLLPRTNEELIKGNTDVPTYYPDVYVPDDAEDWDKECADTRIGVAPRDMAGIGYMKPLRSLKVSQIRLRGDNLANNRPSYRPFENSKELNPPPTVPKQQELIATGYLTNHKSAGEILEDIVRTEVTRIALTRQNFTRLEGPVISGHV